MITKMKKLVLLTPNSSSDLDIDLTQLGQLGVVHIAPFHPASDESIDRVDARIKQMGKAIAVLDGLGENPEPETVLAGFPDYSGMERGEIILMEKVLELEHQRIELVNRAEEIEKALDWYHQWGDVSIDDIEKIRESGILIKLYLLNDRELKRISGREEIRVVGRSGELNQVVLVTDDSNDLLNWEEVSLPGYQQDELQVSRKLINEQLAENETLLIQLRAQKQILQDALEERIRRKDVRSIQYGGMTIEDQVRYWKGFMPESAVDSFIEVANQRSWGYVIEDPSKEDMDEVPTLIRSPRWAERIRPIMNFMGLVPGYKEIDVSKIFMLFFTFFTGILVGDAGYGLIFLILTLLVHRKQKFARKVEYELFYTLSASILFWGVLTGTYFGSEAIANIPFFSRLRIDKLASFGGDNLFIQKIMFLIGAIHLSIGHLQLAWRFSRSVKWIAQLGWVAIIWGLYLIVNQMVLAIPAPGITVWLFIGGGVLIALFSNPGQSFLKGVLSSLANLPLSIISGFSDIISYIRLYAVGLSTVLMASSFNQMAVGEGITTVASVIGAAIVLILGHGLNMILAGMSVIVHGVRLNMLEYAGHADVAFSGIEYNPFKIKNSKSNNF